MRRRATARIGARHRAQAATLTAAVMQLLAAHVALAQSTAPSVPLVSALTLVQTLHERDVERESVVRLADVTSAGVRYEWSFLEIRASGDSVRETHQRFVSAADLDTAPRWHEYYEPGEPLEHPGYTAFSVSRAVYERLRTTGSAPFSVLTFADANGGATSAPMGFGAVRPAVVRWRGTLARVGSAPVAFPLLIDGQRVRVPALHVKGELTARAEHWAPDIWILAQADNPLLLQIADERRVFQTVRADFGAVATRRGTLEGAIVTSCRAELPGIYFEFNSAALAPASDVSIAALREVLARHAAWAVTIEGHTDSIGTAASNQLLSEQRAKAVLTSLTASGVKDTRLRAVGYGATKPRESNTTIEGRARNRRVELVRPCGGIQ